MASAEREPDVMSEQNKEEVLATTEQGLREQALERVKKRRDFHTHVFVYLTINIVLWAIWAIVGVTSHSWFPWPIWVTLAWGLGVVFNAWDVYFRHPITEAEV